MQNMVIRFSALVSLGLLILGSPRCLAQSEAAFFESAGVQLCFFDSGGDGEAVILLAIGGDTSRGRAASLIKGGYRVITQHMRGFGQSDKPPEAKQYGLEMSDDILRLLDHLKIARCHVVGSSIGAHVANRFRAAYPSRLLSATLIGGGPITESSLMLSRAVEFADALDQGDWGPLAHAFTGRGRPLPTQEEIDEQNLRQKQNGSSPIWAAAIRAQGFEDSIDELKTNTVPTLAIVGELDPVKDWEIDPFIGVMAKMEVVVIPDKAHGELGTHELLLSSLLKFLKKNAISLAEQGQARN